MRRRQMNAPFAPFVGFNPYRQGAGPDPKFLVAMEINDGYMCLEYQLGVSQVVMFAAKKSDFDKRFTRLPEPIASLATDLKAKALTYGATLEAIQLLGAILPLSKFEESTMAQAKLARKGADTAGLKAAAKAAPVSGKKPVAAAPKTEAPKRKGNPDALAKARAARAPAGPDTRRISVLNKENPYRADSNRSTAFAAVLKAKTVQDYKDAGGPVKYIARWETEGRIAVK